LGDPHVKLLVILHKSRGHAIAVLEHPTGLSAGATAHAWAEGIGHEYFPADCRWEEVSLTEFGKVMLKILPYTEIDRLEDSAKHIIGPAVASCDSHATTPKHEGT